MSLMFNCHDTPYFAPVFVVCHVFPMFLRPFGLVEDRAATVRWQTWDSDEAQGEVHDARSPGSVGVVGRRVFRHHWIGCHPDLDASDRRHL